MNCNCVPCDECKGSGWVWYSFSGEYLGNHRCDDLDTMETCLECNGQRLSEVCIYCQDYENGIAV